MSQSEPRKLWLLGRHVKEEKYALESRWVAEKFPFKATVTEVKKANLLGQLPGTYWELWPVEALSNGGRTALGKGKSPDIEEASTQVEILARGLAHDLAWYLPSHSITGF